jgi:hypothetical protein
MAVKESTMNKQKPPMLYRRTHRVPALETALRRACLAAINLGEYLLAAKLANEAKRAQEAGQ